MKRKTIGLLSLLIHSLACQPDPEASSNKTYIEHKRQVNVEVKEEPALAKEAEAVTEQVATAPAQTVDAQVILPTIVDPITVPKVDMRYARSIFDDTSDVEPWRANYVGSYGVLPTRFNSEGPFLYSFDRKSQRDGDDF